MQHTTSQIRRRRRLPRGLRSIGLAIVALSVSLLIGGTGFADAASGAKPAPAVTPQSFSVATWAEPPGEPPNYIFPISSCCLSVANRGDFQQLMYRPMYWLGTGSQPTLNPALSLAGTPTYKTGDKVAVVNLKTIYRWSNGEHVDAKDVVFFMNLLKTVKDADWADYSPGYFPDNVKSVTATGQFQVTFDLTSAVSPTWFTDNELSQITPLPTAWDITKTGAAAGSGGCSSASYSTITTSSSKANPIIPTSPAAKRCFAVYNYLANAKTGQAATPTTYASNPLWAVVDGPWRLKTFNSTNGNVEFVPNPSYSGPNRPHLSEFIEIGYSSDISEYTALKAGDSINVGYIPTEDVPQNTGNPLEAGPNAPALDGRYTLSPLYPFQTNFLSLNMRNPALGKVFSQLYVRQAMQSLINQSIYIKTFDAGYGVPIEGPVPVTPPTFASSQDLAGDYPYKPAKAVSLLTTHGWSSARSGKTATCAKPGTGPRECGKGIAAGTKLAFTLRYAEGNASFAAQLKSLASAFGGAGIHVTLAAESFVKVLRTTGRNCFVTGDCSWQAADSGAGWLFDPGTLPTGENIFDGVSGCSRPAQLAVSNAGGYCNATNHLNIAATTKNSALSVLHSYENFLAKRLPVLWLPLPGHLSEIVLHLEGVTPQNPFGALTPEDWEWQKGFG